MITRLDIGMDGYMEPNEYGNYVDYTEYVNLLRMYEHLLEQYNKEQDSKMSNEPSGSGEGRGGPYGTGHYG